MPNPDLLTADDLEWEDPPARSAYRTAVMDQADEVKRMVPALREGVGKWAVLDTFDGPTTAGYRAGKLKKLFAESETIEQRLQFRAIRLLEGGSKLYVRLRAA